MVHLKRVALLGFLMGLGILSIAQAATVTWTVDTLDYTDSYQTTMLSI